MGCPRQTGKGVHLLEIVLPYIYVVGAALDVLLMGTAALVAANASITSTLPRTLALLAAAITWGVTAYLVADPLPIAWQQTGSLATWLPLSVIAVALIWYCRMPPPTEPPAEPQEPPHTYPKINGQWRTPSDTGTIEAEQLRRTYRRKG